MLNDDQLAELNELASLMMTIKEIAIILDIDELSFRKSLRINNSEEYKAYWSGYLKSKAELRKSILQHAKSGSSPAQTLSEKFITEINLDQDE